MKIQGEGGCFAMVVEINQLTDELVMIEVRQRQRGGGDIWSDTLRPFLVEIVHKPDETVAGLQTAHNREDASSLRDVNTTTSDLELGCTKKKKNMFLIGAEKLP
ncbi:hypothetical protein Rs2_06118 [Raphanus sativus]|nr:hypothetical protein Rs2_06118 [Raphanus sativus]